MDLSLYQRSADVPVGVPYNIATYALLLRLMALKTKYIPRYFVHMTDDTHIYDNQIDLVKEQLTREPFPLPEVIIEWETDLLDLSLNDRDMERFSIINYHHHDKIKYPVAV